MSSSSKPESPAAAVAASSEPYKWTNADAVAILEQLAASLGSPAAKKRARTDGVQGAMIFKALEEQMEERLKEIKMDGVVDCEHFLKRVVPPLCKEDSKVAQAMQQVQYSLAKLEAHADGGGDEGPPPDSGFEPQGVKISPIAENAPVGLQVENLDLRQRPSDAFLKDLQGKMADVGLLVFRNQMNLSGAEQVEISEYWGGRRIHSTHGVHPAAPNRHIFRLSNDQTKGIVGVGPQWHNDGSFERKVFSHVGYYIVAAPASGGETFYASTSKAYENLTDAEKETWANYHSINATSGVVHPMVYNHPISGKKHIYLHLGMTGAVADVSKGKDKIRLLDKKEMTDLFHRYNDLLNDPSLHWKHPYREGDLVIIDNLSVAHRADPSAHSRSSKEPESLRILHRTTVAGMINFDPPESCGLEHHGMANGTMDIYGRNPFNKDGVWVAGGLGFRWDESIRMQN